MKCKNIECINETNDKNIYCSLSCRNTYVNKNIRDYRENSNGSKKKKLIKEVEYLNDPKICTCGCIIPFDKRSNKFCNSSCAASFNNKKRDYSNFSESIKTGIHNYLIDNNIKDKSEIGFRKLECKSCKKTFYHKRSNKVYCTDECRINYKRINMTEYQKYKSDCSFKFNIGNYIDEFDFKIIREFGWYSPTNKNNNLGGVSRDHMFSINDGFKQGIDAKLIAHPANCKLMIHTENISKNKTSSITIIELLQRIETFDKKYNNI